MKAFLFSASLILVAACGGGDVSIGNNDSGDPGNDAGMMTGQDSSTGQDGSMMQTDSGGDDAGTGKDGDPNPGTDGGVLTDGGCVPKVFNFQCGQVQCVGGQKEYCGAYPNNKCLMMPQACACDYSCKCLLANIQSPCQGMIAPKCAANGMGGLYLSCN